MSGLTHIVLGAGLVFVLLIFVMGLVPYTWRTYVFSSAGASFTGTNQRCDSGFEPIFMLDSLVDLSPPGERG